MELKCPQCGKWMAVSQEELVIHDCQVVCPQCLAVCSYEGGALVVRDDSDAPYRHTVVVEESKQDTSRFCHSCGKQLPAGISFCPYCGADLKAPFNDNDVAALQTPEPQPVHVPEPTSKPEPVQKKEPVQKPEPVTQKKKSETITHHPTSAHVEDKLRTVSRQYNSVHPRLHQNGTMPGTLFKVVAYTIIFALLALLIYIIVAGINIEPSV
ncbi:MAG: zinc-ribbon domain-containing protein [Muribaculaceae bacterium]|nr:zinc-ribbon domain-containing protein [Muribaculaceae bacterium]